MVLIVDKFFVWDAVSTNCGSRAEPWNIELLLQKMALFLNYGLTLTINSMVNVPKQQVCKVLTQLMLKICSQFNSFHLKDILK